MRPFWAGREDRLAKASGHGSGQEVGLEPLRDSLDGHGRAAAQLVDLVQGFLYPSVAFLAQHQDVQVRMLVDPAAGEGAEEADVAPRVGASALTSQAA